MSVDLQKYAAQLFRPTRRPAVYRQVVSNAPDEIWTADLMVWGRWDDEPEADPSESEMKLNDGHRYILLVEDVFSRYIWAVPLKKKDTVSLKAAWKDVVEQAGGVTPRFFWTDQEGGIASKAFQKMLKDDGVVWYSTFSESGAVLVERAIRDIGRMLRQQLVARAERSWLKLVPDVIKAWNTHKVRTIGATPEQARRPEYWRLVWTKQYGRPPPSIMPRFRVGDSVLISNAHGIYAKKSRAFTFNAEVFTIRQVKPGHPPLYLLTGYDGEEIRGAFYESELQNVSPPASNQQWPIEKIVKTRKRAGKTEYLVRWLGWPEKYDSWEGQDAVKDIL